MPTPFAKLLEKNRVWVSKTNKEDPDYFSRLAIDHKPQYLYIGCSDARVPVDDMTQTPAGEMFIHRNIANMVVPTDANLLAVLQYAVEALQVSDIIVCGHYGCGGVKASMGDRVAPPLVETWLSNIRTVVRMHAEELDQISDEEMRYRRLVELNVIEQVYNLTQTQVVKDAWESGRVLRIHGVVYAINEGLLRDLGVTQDCPVAAGASVQETPAARELVTR